MAVLTEDQFAQKWGNKTQGRFADNTIQDFDEPLFREFQEDIKDSFVPVANVANVAHSAVFVAQDAGVTSFKLSAAVRDKARLRLQRFGNSALLKSLPALPRPVDAPNTPAPGDVLLLPSVGLPTTGSPEVSEFGETVAAGQSIQVTGEQMTSAKAALYANGQLLSATVSGNTSQLAAVQLPTNTGAWGAYVLWLQNGQGYGEPVLLNRTHATWMSTTLAAGVTGHVFGLNLTHGNVAGGASYLYLVHKISGDVVAVPVLPDTIPERISFTTPAVPLGDYWVYPHNGHGGEWGWSERLSCTIVGANDHVKTHEWQVGNAIVNTGGNMAPTINAALLSDSRSNKHTVLAAGTWLAGEGIEIVSYCSLRGQVDGNGVPTTIITPDPARFDSSGDRGLLGSPASKEMVRLENLLIDNSKGAAMGPVNRLVVLRRCRQVWLKNVWVIQPGGGLVRLDEDTSGLYIDDCKLWGGSNANGEPIFVLPSPEAQMFVSNTEFKLYDNADSALNVSGVSQVAILPGCTVGNGDDSVLNGAFAGKGRFLKGSGAYGIGSECWHAEGVVGTNLGVMRDWLGTASNPVLNATNDDNEGEGLMYEGAETRGKLPVVSATRTTITSSSKPTSDKYTGAAPFAHYAHIVRGRGMGQMRRLVANDGNGTLTFDKPWRVIPDSTSLVMYGTYCRFVHIVDCDFSARPGMNGTNYSASKFLEVYGGCHKWRAKRNKIKGFRSGLSTFTTQHNSNDFIDSCSHNDLTDNILIECRYSVRIEVTGEGGGGLPSGGGYPASGQVALHLRNQVVNPVRYNTIIAAARTDDPTTATNFPYPLIAGLLIEGDQPVLPFPNDYRTTSNPSRFPVIDVGPNQLAGVVLAVAASAATVLVAADELGPLEPLPAAAAIDTYGLLTFPEAGQVLLNFLDTKQRPVPLDRTRVAGAGGGGMSPAPAYTAGAGIDITGNVISAPVPELLDPLTYPVMVGSRSLGYVGYPTLEAAAVAAPFRPIVINVPSLQISQDVTIKSSLYSESLVQILVQDGVTVTLDTSITLKNINFIALSTGNAARMLITSTQGANVVLDASQALQLVDSRIGFTLFFSAPVHCITARGRSEIALAIGNPGTIYLYDIATANIAVGGPTPVERRPGTGSGSGAGNDTVLPVTATRTAAYTLALADAGCLVPVSSASAVVITVPAHADVAFPIGTTLYVAQDGAGDVTIAGAGGVVVQKADGYKVGGQWLDVSLHKRDFNTWVLKGGVS